MEATSYLHLHQEHRVWLSQIDFWNGEVAFLKGLCQKLPKHHPLTHSLTHKLDHLSRWLDNMRHQIDSHESFLKATWGDFPESLELTNLEDHGHNRDHMKHFNHILKELKSQIYIALQQTR